MKTNDSQGTDKVALNAAIETWSAQLTDSAFCECGECKDKLYVILNAAKSHLLHLQQKSQESEDRERLLALANWIWATRWMNDPGRLKDGDQDYLDMVRAAAEIRSGNYKTIDKEWKGMNEN